MKCLIGKKLWPNSVKNPNPWHFLLTVAKRFIITLEDIPQMLRFKVLVRGKHPIISNAGKVKKVCCPFHFCYSNASDTQPDIIQCGVPIKKKTKRLTLLDYFHCISVKHGQKSQFRFYKDIILEATNEDDVPPRTKAV